jgi:hypothetical protein
MRGTLFPTYSLFISQAFLIVLALGNYKSLCALGEEEKIPTAEHAETAEDFLPKD